MKAKVCKAASAALLVLGAAVSAEAQAPIGLRAQGMAGAFVGVADDASAVYWNPAGVATGAYVSVVLEAGRGQAIPGDVSAGADRRSGGLVGFSVPPLGVAYYRHVALAAPGPAAGGASGREEVGRPVQAVAVSTLGVALLQSLGDYLVVGATVKLVHGAAGQALSSATGRAALDAADRAGRQGSTTGDIDAGAMLSVARIRLGVVGRNLTTPAFEAAGGSGVVELSREARLGGAWGSGWPGLSRVVVAVDGDLTRRSAVGGERRDVSAGAETWWLGYRLGVRGGVRASTLGEARPVAAAGVSAGVTQGLSVDAHVAAGARGERGWGVGVRFSF